MIPTVDPNLFPDPAHPTAIVWVAMIPFFILLFFMLLTFLRMLVSSSTPRDIHAFRNPPEPRWQEPSIPGKTYPIDPQSGRVMVAVEDMEDWNS